MKSPVRDVAPKTSRNVVTYNYLTVGVQTVELKQIGIFL